METVVIETQNGPVIINKVDFDPNAHKLHTASADAVTTAIDPVNDGTPPSDDHSSEGEGDPKALAVFKDGKKYFVVRQTGEREARPGIDADGYKSEADAWAAVMALAAG